MLPLCNLCPDRPVRNVLVLSTSFLLIFTGYNCSVNLLSSLNIEEGLGVVSQSVLYAVFVLGSFTVPPVCMKTIGVKMSIFVSAVFYAPYVAANFYPSWYTFIPFAFLIGFAAGPLWASALSYITAMAKRHSSGKGGSSTDNTVFLFMGLLFMFFGLSNIFGNIVSFYILKPQGGYSDLNVSREILDLCGVNFCDWTAVESEVIRPPPKEKIWLLNGIYVGCILVGALLALTLLDNVSLSEVGVSSEDSETCCELFWAPLKRFKKAQHWYLLPVTVFAGVEESFLFGDYTKAYVACSWGIYHIGLSMMVCGVVTCIGSLILGLLIKVVDRVILFLSAGVIHSVGIILLWYWTPDTPKYVLYIIPAIWGLVTIVWQSQVRAMYGVVFEGQGSAFSIHAALEALGFLIGFAISSKVCTRPKLWLLAGLLVLSMAGYVAAEVSHRRSKPKGDDSNQQPSQPREEKCVTKF